jgi:hypothetical protein
MKYFVFALLMFIAGLALTRIDRDTPEVRPIIRTRTTTGLFITLVMRQPVKRSICADAVSAFERTLAPSCPTCVMESADCAQSFEGIENALARNEPLPIYTVDSDAFRIALVGPTAAVAAECDKMASEMVRRGAKVAACHAPAIVSAGQ